MALCEYCNQEMNNHLPCLWDSVSVRNQVFTRLYHGQETRYGSGLPDYWKDYGEFCPDCAVAVGGLHHFGCDWEQCPRCGGQQIGCDCSKKQFQ